MIKIEVSFKGRILLANSKSLSFSTLTHVQGVWLNHAIFAPEEVIFLGLECRLDKSVLLKTAML